jgi:hypothetical protein
VPREGKLESFRRDRNRDGSRDKIKKIGKYRVDIHLGTFYACGVEFGGDKVVPLTEPIIGRIATRT